VDGSFIIRKVITINSNILKNKAKELSHIQIRILLSEHYVIFSGKLDGIGGKT